MKKRKEDEKPNKKDKMCKLLCWSKYKQMKK